VLLIMASSEYSTIAAISWASEDISSPHQAVAEKSDPRNREHARR
jgi:hypothetical protein